MTGWQSTFAIAPLDWIEWKAVLLLSAPVVLIDEVLKLLTVRLRLFHTLFYTTVHLTPATYLDNIRFSANQD
jgi:hypothetical protein